jgi:hypothetical protein
VGVSQNCRSVAIFIYHFVQIGSDKYFFSSFNTQSNATNALKLLTHFRGVDVDLLGVQNVDFASLAHKLLHAFKLDLLLFGLFSSFDF